MANIDPHEILEELKLTRVPSMELEEKCFTIITTSSDSDEDYELKEEAVLKLVENYSKHQNITKLKDLIIKIQPIVLNIQKSKTAKLLKSILDIMETVPNTIDIQIELCEFLINWCRKENRNFIRHKIELRLSHLLYEKGKYRESLSIAGSLLTEARKLDDKNLLVEIQLVESRVYFAIKNYAKARASLTACRAAANAIYCNPLLQASIDNQAGVVNAQDKDFKTAYSYFFEAFEVYHQNNKAVDALKNFQYMTMCKILMNATEEVLGLINGKYGIKYLGKELDFLKRVAGAHKRKNLVEFQEIIDTSQEVINQDGIIQSHVQDLYENLLELNLLKSIKPYSKVQLAHIAKHMNLEVRVVQEKLSEMIIDRKINGTLDQGIDCLIVFDEVDQGELYSSATHVLTNMDTVVDKLFQKVDQLKAIS